MLKFPINKLNIAQIFFLLFLTSLFFPVRYVFPTQEAYQTGAYSDFTAISLYLSDIFLFLTLLFILPPRGISFHHVVRYAGVLVTWLTLGILWHFSSLNKLNWWFFAKYLEIIVTYGTVYYLFFKTEIKTLFIRVFVGLSTFESILSLIQFSKQGSFGFGLGRFGEQVIASNIQGIAKIVSGGTTFIRGYGTFPHPNLLSAFLLTGVFFCLYLILNSQAARSKISLALILFINLTGLTVTFSRAGFLALAAGLAIFFGLLFWQNVKEKNKKVFAAALITIISIALCLAIFNPYLLTRATISDDASLERIFYARIGIKIIEQHPLFGIGIGDSVLHMQQYSPIKLWPWQVQPIHNYFLLAAAELGIPGALILLWILLSHLKSLILNLKSQQKNFFSLCLLAILASFLVAMQFDHYFYTLQQTQMLLWVILGIIAAEIKKDFRQEGSLKS